MRSTGWIYFIQAKSGGPVKVGWALNPAARCNDLQTAHPEPLVMRHVRPGSQADEKALHRRLTEAGCHLRGEWFAPTLPLCVEAPVFLAEAVVAAIRDDGDLRASLREALEMDAPSSAGLLSPEEFAARLGVSRRTIYRALRDGQLEGHRVGKLWRIPSSEFAEWHARSRRGGGLDITAHVGARSRQARPTTSLRDLNRQLEAGDGGAR